MGAMAEFGRIFSGFSGVCHRKFNYGTPDPAGLTPTVPGHLMAALHR